MSNYKLIEAHTMQGDPADLWVLLNPENEFCFLKKGVMVSFFSPSSLSPEEQARRVIVAVEGSSR